MRISVEEFCREAKDLLKTAQQERVVITRKGKPLAILFGIENKDNEDFDLERDELFWEMIQERRKEKTVPIGEVKKRIASRRNKAK